ncbi:hypothetical protein QP164_14715 [Sphingomonas sp. LR59]|uniref:hypothetical protein n=1 Tax=Sphingomonas sp. LR59 TaxID=3050232 RepID=UPI002FE0A695
MNLNQFNFTHMPLPIEAVYSNRLIVSGRISRISVYDVPVGPGTEWAQRKDSTLRDFMADALMEKVESNEGLLPFEHGDQLGFNLGSALDHRDYGILVEQGFSVSTMEAFEPNLINITDIALRSMTKTLKKIVPFTSSCDAANWFDQERLPSRAILVTKTDEVGHFEYELPSPGSLNYQKLNFGIVSHDGFPMVTDVYHGKKKLKCVDQSTTHQQKPAVDMFVYH